VEGPLGHYYLSQTEAGQLQNSPCVDTGSEDASELGLTRYTTRTDEVVDKGFVDMGYHYPLSKMAEPCKLCDLFYDGLINFNDFAKFAVAWLNETCSDSDWCGGADLTFDGFVDIEDLAFFADCWLVEDIHAPVPNPSQWLAEPYSASTSAPYSISMTAEDSYDAWGWNVQYYFECVSDSNYDSGWQSDPNYDVDDLALGTELCFRVRAQDELGNQTVFSKVECAIASGEEPQKDTTPPSRRPYIVQIYSSSPNSITMLATESFDDSGVEYYFRNLTIEDHDSDWQEGRTYTDVNLVPETEYCYQVRARDMTSDFPDDGTGESGNKTLWSDVKCVTTLSTEDHNNPSPDPMDWDYSLDVNGFDGRPQEIYRGGGTWDYWATMRADPDTDDDSGSFEFRFECLEYKADVGEGGFSSGWISFAGPPYIYTVNVGRSEQGLSFHVQARDPSLNKTGWSSTEVAAPPFP